MEQKREKVKNLRPIDDVFFEALAGDKAVCQEILRVILEDGGLTVEDVVVQASERNLYGRSVRLNALCTLGNGTKCNIEVQRSDKDNHLKRVRFNAASITVRESKPGDRFDEVLELYVVYISEFDFFKEGKTIYHVDKVLRETGTIVDDGLHEIFVNMAVDDGTDIAKLMSCFKKTRIKEPKFPALSAGVRRLKDEEGGVKSMSEIMERYEKIAEEKGRKEGRLSSLADLVRKGILDESIAIREAGLSKQEFEEWLYRKA